jgi:AcrR family transcriptional regulator
MTDTDFDTQLVAAAFALGADQGWRKVSAAAAARHAGLDLAIARAHFGSRAAILRKFGELADRAALTGALTEGSVRDRLFDTLLRRFDFLQTHRAGVAALLKCLPAEPALAICLANATIASMGWLLEAAGVTSTGIRGELAKRGLAIVWGYGTQAWLKDESPDLTATMAAVDTALNRADSIAARFTPAPPDDAPFTPPPEPELPFPEEPSGVA